MRKTIFLSITFLLLGFNAWSQKNRPYHQFGIGFNFNYSKTFATLDQKPGNYHWMSAPITSRKMAFDIYAPFDYGIYKWLGVRTGAGLSIRGMSNGDILAKDWRKDVFLLTVPTIIQFKTGSLIWIETGAKFHFYLFSLNSDDAPDWVKELDGDKFSATANLALRVNIFEGLSIAPFMDYGIRPLFKYSDENATVRYYDLTYGLGLRYMFDN